MSEGASEGASERAKEWVSERVSERSNKRVLTDGEDAKLRLLSDSAPETPSSETERVLCNMLMSVISSGECCGASDSAEGKATEARCLIWAALGFIQHPHACRT